MTEPFKKYRKNAIGILKNNWKAVVALALALLEEKKLSRKKSREIIGQAITQ